MQRLLRPGLLISNARSPRVPLRKPGASPHLMLSAAFKSSGSRQKLPSPERTSRELTIRDVLDAVAGVYDKLDALPTMPAVASSRAAQVDEMSSLPAKISELEKQVAALSALSGTVAALSEQTVALSLLPEQISALSKEITVLSTLPDKIAALSMRLSQFPKMLSALPVSPKMTPTLPEEATTVPVKIPARHGNVSMRPTPVAWTPPYSHVTHASLQPRIAPARPREKAAVIPVVPKMAHALVLEVPTVPVEVPASLQGDSDVATHMDSQLPHEVSSLRQKTCAFTNYKNNSAAKVTAPKSPDTHYERAMPRELAPPFAAGSSTRVLSNAIDLLRACVPRGCLLPSEHHLMHVGMVDGVLLERARLTAVSNMLVVSA